MFIVNWFTGVLGFLGLWKTYRKLLFLGLENSGKTTLLHLLKDDKLVETLHTLHPTSDNLTIGSKQFTIFEIAGPLQARGEWRDYICSVDAVVFLVDTSDRERLLESKAELDSLLTDKMFSDCPVLIIGNKIEKHGAVSEEELKQFFHLHKQTTGKGMEPRSELPGRPLELFMCSLRLRHGYSEGFRWLAQYID